MTPIYKFQPEMREILTSIINDVDTVKQRVRQLKSGGLLEGDTNTLESFAFEYDTDSDLFKVSEYLTDKFKYLETPPKVLGICRELLKYISPHTLEYFIMGEFALIKTCAEIYDDSPVLTSEQRFYLGAIAKSRLIKAFKNSLIDVYERDIALVLDRLGINNLALNDLFKESQKQFEEQRLIISNQKAQGIFKQSSYEIIVTAPAIELIHEVFSIQKHSEWLDKIMIEKEYSLGEVSIKYPRADSFIEDNSRYVFPIINIIICAFIASGAAPNGFIKISGSQILEALRITYKNLDRNTRLGKNFTMEFLAKMILFIRDIDINNGIINVKKEKIYTGLRRLINIESVMFESQYYEGKKGFYVEDVLNFEIHYKIDWLKTFYHGDVTWLGYCHKESFVDLTSMKTLLIQYLSYKLEQHKSGDFRILTLLEALGYEKLFDVPRYQKQDIYNKFKKALDELGEIDEPYTWHYRNPPKWVSEECNRKPKNWWDDWMYTVIVFQKPERLRKISPRKIKSTLEAKISVDEIKTLFSNSTVSQRAVSKYLGKSHGYVNKILNMSNPSQKDLKDIIDAINWLSKKPK